MHLTPAQQRILDKVMASGCVTLNERARRPVTALQAAGLVRVEWVVCPDALRGRHTLHAIVTPEQARSA